MHYVEVSEEFTGVGSVLHHVVSGSKLVIRLGGMQLDRVGRFSSLYLIYKQQL